MSLLMWEEGEEEGDSPESPVEPRWQHDTTRGNNCCSRQFGVLTRTKVSPEVGPSFKSVKYVHVNTLIFIRARGSCPSGLLVSLGLGQGLGQGVVDIQLFPRPSIAPMQ